MGKQGPCHHCGVTSTPLWRNGPPEKPVLCNACGSRWRTKGSLANYFPLHLREFPSMTENKIPKAKSISFKKSELKSYSKRKCNPNLDRPSCIAQIKRETPYCGQNFPKGVEEDISNRSSSGSVISYSESCAHFDTTDANELNASAQSDAWEPVVPSEKKTDIASPKSAHVVKLTKDLYNILHEQSSYLSGPSEEDLIFESEAPTGSIEIGHGGVLIKLPDPKFVDEESEASSLPVESKSYITNEAHSGSSSFLVHYESKGTDNSHINSKKIAQSTARAAQNHVKRDKFSSSNLHILQDRESLLVSIDLKDLKHRGDSCQKEGTILLNVPEPSDTFSLKRPLDNRNLNCSELKDTMRSSKRSSKGGADSSIKSYQFDSGFLGEEASFSRGTLFSLPSVKNSIAASVLTSDDASDQDLLVDVPFNSSFPEAELLFNPSKQVSSNPS